MKKTIFLFLGLLLSVSIYSQEIKSYVISSTGASIMGGGGSLYLSIGEPMNTEISGGEIMIAQGFLQVSISETTSTENVLNELIRVFPNPTASDLVIEMPEMNGNYQYQLFNSLGAGVETKEINTIRTKVDLQDLGAGTYFLKVIKGSESSKTLRIIKL